MGPTITETGAVMLELVPRVAMSQRYSVRRDGVEVAEVALAWFREGGELVIEGVPHELRREGLGSGAFTLTRDAVVIARAHKPSAFHNRFEVEHDGRRYELVKAAWWMRRFELRSDGQTIGSIAPQHPFTRRCEIALPVELGLAVKVFLAALVALMWNRDASAASSSSGGGMA
jgi:hypothetical protein